MEELLIKLHTEEQELIHKISKLTKFRESDDYKNLSVYHKGLLEIQLNAMKTYLEVIMSRVVDIKTNQSESELKTDPDRILIIISDKKD